MAYCLALVAKLRILPELANHNMTNILERLRLIWAKLCGGAVVGDGQVPRCGREHLPGGFKAVAADELRALQIAADDLKVARGVIAGVGKTKDYIEIRDATVEKA